MAVMAVMAVRKWQLWQLENREKESLSYSKISFLLAFTGCIPNRKVLRNHT